RDRTVAAYASAFADRDWVRLPQPGSGADVDWFVYVIRLDAAHDRDRLIRQADRRGVPSRPYFSPIHLQPLYAELGYRAGDFPVTERVARSTLAIPFSSRMDDDAVDRVVAALDESVAEQGRG